jgi:hypothetical protein
MALPQRQAPSIERSPNKVCSGALRNACSGDENVCVNR